MVTETLVPPDTEPTPEFNERCMVFVTGWRHGDIPTDDALNKLKSLTREAASAGHMANQGRAEHLIGYIQHYLGNYAVSNTHYETARRLFQRVDNRSRMALMDLNMGENYRYRGEFKRARHLYRTAYQTGAEIDDVTVKAFAITNEGLTLISLDDFANARKALTEGLALAQQLTESDQLQTIFTEIFYGLAQVELALYHYQEAWENAYLALNHANESHNLHSVGLAYRILGDALTALHQPPEGAPYDNPDDYYRAACDTFKEIDAEAEYARTVLHHAKSMAERGRRRNATQLLRNAMVIFTRLGMTSDAADVAEIQLSMTG